MNFDIGRTLRWYVPSWLGLCVLTIALTVTHVARPAIAVLWIALFLGSIAAIALLVIADELAEPSEQRPLPPFEPVRPFRLTADVLPPARSKPRPILRSDCRVPRALSRSPGLSVSVPVLADMQGEGEETIGAVLTNLSTGLSLGPASGTVTISDD
ncbi:MAG: hypothetical protein ACXV9P_18235 [Acidimicrobiia bacterium]